jgi:hypothetical protein
MLCFTANLPPRSVRTAGAGLPAIPEKVTVVYVYSTYSAAASTISFKQASIIFGSRYGLSPCL